MHFSFSDLAYNERAYPMCKATESHICQVVSWQKFNREYKRSQITPQAGDKTAALVLFEHRGAHVFRRECIFTDLCVKMLDESDEWLFSCFAENMEFLGIKNTTLTWNHLTFEFSFGYREHLRGK